MFCRILSLVTLMLISPLSVFGDETPGGRRIVIVCDGSGSSLQYAEQMRAFVRTIIAEMKEDERLNIYFASDDESHSLVIFPQTLNKIRKERMEKFLGSVPHGSDAMAEGIGWAVGQVPDVLWIITDGNMDNSRGIANILLGAEGTRHFKIGVINLGTKEIDARIASIISVYKAAIDPPKPTKKN